MSLLFNPVPPGLATFDSSTAMLRATAAFLHGRDFPTLGEPRYLHPLAVAANWLPARWRTLAFSIGGALEGLPPNHAERISAEEVALWMADQYPRRRYPAAMIGSSNGALVHACAALGIPWLPQTFLTLIRRRDDDPDDAARAFEEGRELRQALAARNPGIAVHHMHDPVQDRIMIERVAYFRLKHRRLPAAYTAFLGNLAPGATLYVVDCRESWPLVHDGERQYFQFGAVGGPEPREYFEPSPRVADYLRRIGARRQAWKPPEPDTTGPEAEWGFDEHLAGEVEALAAARGLRLVRLSFEHPEDVSPLVADLYRAWYRERGVDDDRLAIESFVLLDPQWILRAGVVPFWMVFNVERSAPRIEDYLSRAGPFRDIYMMLFPNGTEGLGLGSLDLWRGILERARKDGRFLGVDEGRYPRDFAAFARYHTALRRLGERAALPPYRDLDWFESFVRRHGPAYRVRLVESEPARVVAR